MKKPDKNRLVQAIAEKYGFDRKLAQYHADRMLEQTPEFLWPNIEEWMEDRTLSEIPVGRYTVPMILHIRGDRDFMDALDTLVCFSHDPAVGESRIWRTVG